MSIKFIKRLSIEEISKMLKTVYPHIEEIYEIDMFISGTIGKIHTVSSTTISDDKGSEVVTLEDMFNINDFYIEAVEFGDGHTSDILKWREQMYMRFGKDYALTALGNIDINGRDFG